MAVIAIRVTDEVKDKLQKRAKSEKVSVSDILRPAIDDLIENDRAPVLPQSEWMFGLRTISGLRINQIKYFYRQAKTTEEFFAMISDTAKSHKLEIRRHPTKVFVVYHKGDSLIYSTNVDKEMPKTTGIGKVVKEIYDQINKMYAVGESNEE
jgi:hypothetical protein